MKVLGDMIIRNVERHPDKVAIVFQGNEGSRRRRVAKAREDAMVEPTTSEVKRTGLSMEVHPTRKAEGVSHQLDHGTSVDRKSPIPLYYQLYRLLLDKIEDGEWKPGDLVSSEKELSEQHGLSRITIRQTLQRLVTDGYLYRERGRGTF